MGYSNPRKSIDRYILPQPDFERPRELSSLRVEKGRSRGHQVRLRYGRTIHFLQIILTLLHQLLYQTFTNNLLHGQESAERPLL